MDHHNSINTNTYTYVTAILQKDQNKIELENLTKNKEKVCHLRGTSKNKNPGVGYPICH